MSIINLSSHLAYKLDDIINRHVTLLTTPHSMIICELQNDDAPTSKTGSKAVCFSKCVFLIEIVIFFIIKILAIYI
jgi:hypothetical protein